MDGPSRYPGFLVPLEISTAAGELRLLGTAMHFLTHYDVTLSELRIEAFLPADDATAAALRRHGARTPGTPIA